MRKLQFIFQTVLFFRECQSTSESAREYAKSPAKRNNMLHLLYKKIKNKKITKDK